MRDRNSTTNFAKCVTYFLSKYLPGERNLSSQTIRAYSIALKMYIQYLNASLGLKPESIEFGDVTAETIKGFLISLGESKCISPNTHNQRLSALKSFVRYAILEYPAFLMDGQRILAIQSKRSSTHEIVYLEKEAMKALLEIPDQSNIHGRRDLALMALLYDSGARIQEIIGLKVKDIRLEKPESVTLLGKGRKTRTVPMMTETANLVNSYMFDRGFFKQSASGDLNLFNSKNRASFTRPGITRILKHYFAIAKMNNPNIRFPEDIHPHMIRASRAIHLLESGVNIIIIRDFLGHTSVATTQIYLSVNSKAKQDAITQAYPSLIEEVPAWRENNDLMALLKELCS